MNIEKSLPKQILSSHSRHLANAQTDTVTPAAPALQEHSKPRSSDADFYAREESPWLPKNLKGEMAPSCSALSEEAVEEMKGLYLKKLDEQAHRALIRLFDSYHNLKSQLTYTHPELSRKYFGFTLGIDQHVMITDPDGVLTPAEAAFLTEQFNNRARFKEDLCTHARLLMTQVDHDRERFPDRYKINLETFSQIIDYGQLFSRNTIGSFLKVLNYQLERNADKIEEKKPDSLIDVHA